MLAIHPFFLARCPIVKNLSSRVLTASNLPKLNTQWNSVPAQCLLFLYFIYQYYWHKKLSSQLRQIQMGKEKEIERRLGFAFQNDCGKIGVSRYHATLGVSSLFCFLTPSSSLCPREDSYYHIASVNLSPHVKEKKRIQKHPPKVLEQPFVMISRTVKPSICAGLSGFMFQYRTVQDC